RVEASAGAAADGLRAARTRCVAEQGVKREAAIVAEVFDAAARDGPAHDEQVRQDELGGEPRLALALPVDDVRRGVRLEIVEGPAAVRGLERTVAAIERAEVCVVEGGRQGSFVGVEDRPRLSAVRVAAAYRRMLAIAGEVGAVDVERVPGEVGQV